MNNIEKLHNKVLGEKTVHKLKENGFDAIYFDEKKDAVEHVMKFISKYNTVGFGGSYTVKELGLKEKIEDVGSKIFDHGDKSLSFKEKLEVQRAELTSDVFLCSSNAITLNGELVNVDGAGNRVAAMTFGPKKVIIVAGVNKLCRDEIGAMERIKMYAAPKNIKRLKFDTPCSENGVCANCKSKNRICRVYSVIKRKPMFTDITVVIVGENLGF